MTPNSHQPDPPHVQTRHEIQHLLARAGAAPQRRLGQNFLIDGNLMRALLDAAQISPQDVVLEVGPGTGALTEHLIRRACRVVAVEIDRLLFDLLRDRFAGADNLTLIQGDVLSTKHQIAPAVSNALADGQRQSQGQSMLVANLPYNVATPLLIDLLLHPSRIARMCFTVQREVGQRLLARPGTRDYGPVSVAMQSTCKLELLHKLPPTVFWPQPKIDSVMLRADFVQNPFACPHDPRNATRHPAQKTTHDTPHDAMQTAAQNATQSNDDALNRLARFFALVRACFNHRRKTMRHNLSRAAGDDACARVGQTLDLTRRPETLTVDEWVWLGREIEAKNGGDTA